MPVLVETYGGTCKSCREGEAAMLFLGAAIFNAATALRRPEVYVTGFSSRTPSRRCESSSSASSRSPRRHGRDHRSRPNERLPDVGSAVPNWPLAGEPVAVTLVHAWPPAS
jgi:hypothetical protein